MKNISSQIKPERYYQGIAVSPGIAEGTVCLHTSSVQKVPFYEIKKEDVVTEMERFKKALTATQEELTQIQQRVAVLIGINDASLFDAHLLVIEDPMLLKDISELLEQEQCNVEYAFDTIVKRSCNNIRKRAESPYLEERTLDLEDVSQRVLRHLLGSKDEQKERCHHQRIFVAHTVTASDAAMLYHDQVIGFATEVGSKTSHTAIIARALGIPVVVGFHRIISELEEGDAVLLDGYSGVLIVNPTTDTLRHYYQVKLRQQYLDTDLEKIRETVPETKDGHRIGLSANIELPYETESASKSGAEGIGLYRTEFLYLNRIKPPEEEEQCQIFRKIATDTQPHNVVIRTFDIGADKSVKFLQLETEVNPALGCRGIRLALKHKDLFKSQLKAILRASVEGNLKIMYPMISGLKEVREANLILEEAKKELHEKDIPFCRDIEVGIMIEVPSAALITDLLAKEVDFLSIGTNDLFQYMLALDRSNENIVTPYDPAHTGVVRILKTIVDAAHQAGISVSICGELAGDIIFTPLLLGLGVDELSASPVLIPRIKKAIQSLDYSICQELVAKILQGDEVEKNYQQCLALAEKEYSVLLTEEYYA